MPGHSGSDPRSDAELVAAAAMGGSTAQSAFAAIYDRYSPALFGFTSSVLRNQTEAADAVQDIFIVAMQRVGTLREPDKLRAWLFSIARFDTMARVRKRVRFTDGEVPEMASTDRSPEQLVAADEVASVVWEAAGGLNERDRAVIELNVRHGLEGAELADALGMAPAASYVVLSRAKDQMARAVGALLLARGGRKDCDELAALLTGWDGRYTPIIRKRVARHAEDCDVCSRRSVAVTRALSALAAVPVLAPPAALREQVLGRLAAVGGSPPGVWHNHSWTDRGFPEPEPIEDPLAWLDDAGTPHGSALVGRSRLFIGAGIAAVVVLIGVALLAARSGHSSDRGAIRAVASAPSSASVVSTISTPPLPPGTTPTAPSATRASVAAVPPASTVVTTTTTTGSASRASRITTTRATVTAAANRAASTPTSMPVATRSTNAAPTTRRTTPASAPTSTPSLTPTSTPPISTTRAVTTTAAAGSTAASSTIAVTSTPPTSSTSTTATTQPATSTSTTALATSTTATPTTAPTTKPISSTSTTPADSATTTKPGAPTSTIAELQITSIQQSSDVVNASPCRSGPTEETLSITVAGGAQPITAVAKVSDGTSHVLDPSGAANFKTVIGAFKTAQIGTYTWAATVTDANGATVTKASPLKFVVVACP